MNTQIIGTSLSHEQALVLGRMLTIAVAECYWCGQGGTPKFMADVQLWKHGPCLCRSPLMRDRIAAYLEHPV